MPILCQQKYSQLDLPVFCLTRFGWSKDSGGSEFPNPQQDAVCAEQLDADPMYLDPDFCSGGEPLLHWWRNKLVKK